MRGATVVRWGLRRAGGAALLVLVGACVAPSQARRAPAADDPLLPLVERRTDQGTALAPGGLPDELARRLLQAHRQLGRGRPPVSGVVRGHMGTGQEQGFTAQLNAGFCYSVLAVSRAEGVELDLLLFDRRGDNVGQDLRPQGAAVVEVCPRENAAYRIVVRVFRGSGEFALQLFGS